MELVFTPTLDWDEAERRLSRLLVQGSVHDDTVAGRIDRVARSFAAYAACYPLPLWAPGLVVGNEMRGLTETLLPISELRPVFELVLRRGCRFDPLFSASYLHGASCYLDLLQKFTLLRRCDPSLALREIALDGCKRRTFLFALFLPQHFGGAFDRYPLQSAWIRGWLRDNRERLQGGIRVLDSACGSGEGTYGLAELLLDAGFAADACAVHGSTIEEIELFAAAHAFFPHDPGREKRYRARIAPLLGRTDPVTMQFHLEDVAARGKRERYHLILCNGLLGGPIMNGEAELKEAIGALAARLEPGGVLLAADRFHEGWRVRVPARTLAAIMREHGLSVLEVPEGVAAEKART